jgi:hypothetical protein
VILIVCEGKVTEAEYLEGFRRHHAISLVRVEMHNGAGVPKSVVQAAVGKKRASIERAARERDENVAYDQVWCVVDTDSHPKMHEAVQQAKDNGIELVVSNPCVELWLLLHFTDQSAFIDRKPLKRALKRFVKDYDKHVEFQAFEPGYMMAVSRAKTLERRNNSAGTVRGNPSTELWRLTEEMKKYARK